MTGVIRTFSGVPFKPLAPRADEILIEDIAHHLGNICRFTGAVKRFYSVAQHSFLVSKLCAPEHALWGLLHDASEAYLTDVASPIKYTAAMDAYRAVEAQLQRVIFQRFGLVGEVPAEIHALDQSLAAIEADALMAGGAAAFGMVAPADMKVAIVPVAPDVASRVFLRRYHELVADRQPASAGAR